MDRQLGEVVPAVPKTREVRLGLVMYGGVSLAVYINGVAREFFRAVHGNGVYKLLKRLIDSDIVVDIVSGTSAGGINGIFLAYALANGKDFRVMADLWRNHGDIDALLRDPLDLPPRCASVLNSEGYYQPRLEEAFALMDRTDYVGRDDDPSQLRELDLFVTGTDIDGRIYTTFDDNGHPIDVKEHRTVFLLKHRYDRKEPFAHRKARPDTGAHAQPEDCYRALATLSRITSCFPAAFAAVEVVAPDTPANDPEGGITKRAHDALRRWGKLKHRRFFLDGGVLDNKPFTYTIHEMVYRTKDREIERQLFYVEPDPERFDREKQNQDLNNLKTPTFGRSAMAGIMTIPGYESIDADLKLLAQYNDNVARYEQICAKSSPIQKTTTQFAVTPTGEESGGVYARARMAQLVNRAVEGILRENGERVLLQDEDRAAAAMLASTFSQRDQRNERRTALHFDVYFRQRRLFHIAELLRKQVKENRKNEETGARDLLRAVNRLMRLWEIVRFWMEKVVDDGHFDWKAAVAQDEATAADRIWDDVKSAMQQLLDFRLLAEQLPEVGALIADAVDVESGRSQAVLTLIHEALETRCNAILAAESFPPIATDFDGLLSRIDEFEQALIKKFDGAFAGYAEVEKNYAYFIEVDACLFPIQLFSGVDEREIVRITRISPADAQRGFSKRKLKEKVAGDELAHFSGFFSKAWRSNDILWGRLDGACQLLETLLTRQRLEEVRKAGRLAVSLPELQSMFPHATDARLQPVIDAIASLASGAMPKNFDAFREHLIELAQAEILHEDIPTLLTDQHYEATLWKKPRTDRAKAESAARQAADAKMAKLLPKNDNAIRPSETALGRWFNDPKQSLGGQSIKIVPKPVRRDLLFRALCVTRTVLLNTFEPEDDTGKKKRKPIVLVRGLSRVLDFFAFFYRRRRYGIRS